VAWINDDMVLYHGCSDQSLSTVNPTGIIVSGPPYNITLNIGATRPDFGPGFYTTTWLHQAKNWANLRVAKLRRRHPNVRAVVLAMRIERNRFANLESLVFASDRDNYYPFITYCRGGGTPHADLAYRGGPYDVIVGPVSLGTQQLVIAQADQVSFHTVNATAAITNLSILDMGNPNFDLTE
jgi:hypothetical protein